MPCMTSTCSGGVECGFKQKEGYSQYYLQQFKTFDHLLRSPPNHPAHAIYNFNPSAEEWSIGLPHGAPRTRSGDVLAKHPKQLRTTLLEASNIVAGCQTLLFVPSPCPRGKSLM